MRAAALIALLLVFASAATASPRTPRVPAFSHVVVIMFENKDRGTVIGARDAPTFNAMGRRYAQLTRYYGVTHPSLPNYLALISGSTQGVASDCTTCSFDAKTLATTLPEAGRTWKLYAEGLPRPGFAGASYGRYAKKHAPFLYFRGVDTRRVVPLTQLRLDLAHAVLPSYAMIVPNLCNSMHDCSVRTGDAWLRRQLPPLLKLPNTVVFVLFDEGTYGSDDSGGHVPALALGTAVRPHSAYTHAATHYGLLRTIEDAWGLPRLGRTETATPITGIWRDAP